jgi:hypothetical protein
MSVSARVGKPQLTQPAAATPHSVPMSPKALTKAKTRSLLYMQDLLVVAGLDAAEGHGGTVGEPEGEDGRGDVRAEGHDTGVPADLNTGFQQLLDGRGAVVVGRTEDVEAAFLVLFDDHPWRFPDWGGTDDGGKTGCRTVHELHAAFTQDGVVGRAEPDLAGSMSGSSSETW